MGQHLVGLVDLLELFFCRFIARVLVGVVLHGKLTVSLLDLRIGCVFLDAQNLIIISFVLICHMFHLFFRCSDKPSGADRSAPVD